jgi:hypothetical protein
VQGVLDWELSPEAMEKIGALESDFRWAACLLPFDDDYIASTSWLASWLSALPGVFSFGVGQSCALLLRARSDPRAACPCRVLLDR